MLYQSQRLYYPIKSQSLYYAIQLQSLYYAIQSQSLYYPIKSQRLYYPIQSQSLFYPAVDPESRRPAAIGHCWLGLPRGHLRCHGGGGRQGIVRQLPHISWFPF